MAPIGIAPLLWVYSRVVAKVGAVGFMRGFKKYESKVGTGKAKKVASRLVFGGVAVGGGTVAAIGTDSLPDEFEGRVRFLAITDSSMRAIGDMQRKDSPAAKSRLDAKQGQNLMATTPEYKRVSAVATNVLAAYNDKLQPSLQLPRFEAGRLFVVVQDEINAYTMPNGDIYVNTGLLDAIALGARNSELGPLGADDILAFVLGHEVGHNVLQHINERISSTSIMAFFKMAAVSALTMVLPPGLDGALEAMLYFGLDTKFEDVMFLLPYSRLHELEADHMGLLIAAAACYHSPTGSKAFFDVMESLKESQARIVQANNKTNNETNNKKDDKTHGNVKDEVRDDDYLATHPSHSSRREQVARLAHKAEALLTESRCAHIRKDLERSARAFKLNSMPSGLKKWLRV